MMLIANYIGLRRKDPVALELAQRWSKVAAVTFAVGAVTGTVLSFEFGLLWPEFTERFGEVFGVLFTIEGIFFFLEAIFLTIYIFGWKRLGGLEALLDGRAGRDLRDRGRLLGGRRQLLDEPAPGLHAGRRRRRHRRRPAQGDLQPRGALRGPAHDPGRLPGHLLPGRLGLRGRDAAGAPRPPPPPRPADPAHGRLHPGADPVHGRRHGGARDRQGPADQVRRDGVRAAHPYATSPSTSAAAAPTTA